MKIINLKEFRKLKPGVIFSKYQPCVFSDIMAKGETWEYDFICETITNDVDCDDTGEFVDNCTAMEKGESKPLTVDTGQRDGMFEEKQLFAIYEKEDIEQLIDKLERCKKEAYV